MRKIVILKDPATDPVEGCALRRCLEMFFPECDIEIQPTRAGDNPDKDTLSALGLHGSGVQGRPW